MVYEIRLVNQRGVVVIDEQDYGLVCGYRWRLHNNGYAQTKIDGCSIYMHRFILGLKVGDHQQIDHVNNNKLDNRRANLRICDQTHNQANRLKLANCSSIYKGVRWDKRKRKWETRLRFRRQCIFLGLFVSEEEAALAYDHAASIYFGEFARLNFGKDG